MSKLLLSALLLGLAALACNFPGTQQDSEADVRATSAAETVAAQLTELSGTQPADEPTQPVDPDSTATTAPEPSPTGSPTPDCTNLAGFVEDVTIPDDTNVPAGDGFEKIWRLRNEGTCTWTTDYDVVFDDGNIMAGPPSSPLPSEVPPDGTVDVELGLTAPISDGTHRGDWMLRTPDGDVFGLGDEGETPFFVQIVVGPDATELENWLDEYSLSQLVET